MSIKKIVIELEKHMHLKFPEFGSKFYSNRRNFYIHLGWTNFFFLLKITKPSYKKLTFFKSTYKKIQPNRPWRN